MSKAPTLFLGFTLVVLAAALALLWQAFGLRPAPSPAGPRPQATRAPLSANRPPEEPGVRTILPGPRPGGARPSAPEAAGETAGEAAKASPPPVVTAPAPVPEPAPGRSTAIVPPPFEDAQPATGEGVDLNTAPLEQLNALGAGMIGRTIIAGRPYSAPDDLLARRILNRRDFETIRPRVGVR